MGGAEGLGELTPREMMSQNGWGERAVDSGRAGAGGYVTTCGCNPRGWPNPRGAGCVTLPETGPSMPGCPVFLCPVVQTS